MLNLNNSQLLEIENGLSHNQGFINLKDSDPERGDPGLLLSNNIFQALHDQNGKQPISTRQKAEYRQWLEYVSVYGCLLQKSSSAPQILKELNSVLAMKSFLSSSSSQTVIDAVFYGLLHNIMSGLSHQEKEKYIHLSRWFNTVQQDPQVRKSRSLVTFSKTPLYL